MQRTTAPMRRPRRTRSEIEHDAALFDRLGRVAERVARPVVARVLHTPSLVNVVRSAIAGVTEGLRSATADREGWTHTAVTPSRQNPPRVSDALVNRCARRVADAVVRSWVDVVDTSIEVGQPALTPTLLPVDARLRSRLVDVLGNLAVDGEEALGIVGGLGEHIFDRSGHAELPLGIRLARGRSGVMASRADRRDPRAAAR